ncbi:MAG: LLM class flavin-dependent oxidoreductase [Nocardioidaceae bacterium]
MQAWSFRVFTQPQQGATYDELRVVAQIAEALGFGAFFRSDRMEESLAVVTGLWDTPLGERFDFGGTHYQLAGPTALPKPVQSPRPPVILGGMGKRCTPQLAARYADEPNLPFASLAQTVTQFGRVRDACAGSRARPRLAAGLPAAARPQRSRPPATGGRQGAAAGVAPYVGVLG